MGKADGVTERQLTVLVFVGLLSPMIRILPTAAVMFGGRAAWLSPLVALIVGRLFLAFTRWARKNVQEGVGLADMTILALGKAGGRVLCGLYALWLTFYGGFVARSAAERLLSTVYPSGNVTVFLVVMILSSLIAALGQTRTLARTAEILMPVLLAVILAVLLSAIPDVSAEHLLPVTYRDAGRVAAGALPVFNVLAGFVFFLFLGNHVTVPKAQRPNRFPWLLILSAVAFGVTFFTLGTLGEGLSVGMENAFFMLIRNIKVFGVVERVEAVVVALWIVTDFVFLAALLMSAAEIWRTVAGAKKRAPFAWPGAALAGAAAFLIARNAFDFQRWSDYLVPAINLTLCGAVAPAVLVIGKLRRKF